MQFIKSLFLGFQMLNLVFFSDNKTQPLLVIKIFHINSFIKEELVLICLIMKFILLLIMLLIIIPHFDSYPLLGTF
jgi:hypothetical protein